MVKKKNPKNPNKQQQDFGSKQGMQKDGKETKNRLSLSIKL